MHKVPILPPANTHPQHTQYIHACMSINILLCEDCSLLTNGIFLFLVQIFHYPMQSSSLRNVL